MTEEIKHYRNAEGVYLGSSNFEDDGWIECPIPEDARQVWDEEAGAWGEAPPIPPPNEISDRQFFQLLAMRGLITEDEALEAVGPGIIPASLQALIDQLPEEQRFAAKLLIRGATTFERNHPVTTLLSSIYEWTSEETDAFWREAASL